MWKSCSPQPKYNVVNAVITGFKLAFYFCYKKQTSTAVIWGLNVLYTVIHETCFTIYLTNNDE